MPVVKCINSKSHWDKIWYVINRFIMVWQFSRLSNHESDKKLMIENMTVPIVLPLGNKEY